MGVCMCLCLNTYKYRHVRMCDSTSTTSNGKVQKCFIAYFSRFD